MFDIILNNMLFNIKCFILLIVLLGTYCKSYHTVQINDPSDLDLDYDYSSRFNNVNYLISSCLSYLNSRNIEYTLIFDSLYSTVRNSTLLTSLNNDVDILIPSIVNGTDIKSYLTQDLEIITENNNACNKILIKGVECKLFRLNKNLMLMWKNNSVNWQVSIKNINKHPYINIYTYSINNTKFFIPNDQLINTPIDSFEFDVDDIFPFETKIVKFCSNEETKDGNYSNFHKNCINDIYYKVPISLNILANSEKILKKIYYENGLKAFKFNSLTTLPITIFNSTSILPTSIYSPPLLGSNQLVLFRLILSRLIKTFIKYDISYSLIFGSLLAAVRNKVLIMPYDDDIDLVIPEKINGISIKEIISKNLKEAVSSSHCTISKKKKGGCQVWKITSNIFLTWKVNGVNWKVSMMGHKLPFIDIYTYSNNKTHIYIPPKQLINGHIHRFEQKIEDALPFKPKKFKFCGEKLNADSTYTNLYHKSFTEPFTEPIELNIMQNSEIILKKSYGNDVLTTCITSHNHAHSKFVNSSFPCQLLPERYFHHHKNNSGRNNNIHIVIFDYNLAKKIALLSLMFTAFSVYYFHRM